MSLAAAFQQLEGAVVLGHGSSPWWSPEGAEEPIRCATLVWHTVGLRRYGFPFCSPHHPPAEAPVCAAHTTNMVSPPGGLQVAFQCLLTESPLTVDLRLEAQGTAPPATAHPQGRNRVKHCLRHGAPCRPRCNTSVPLSISLSVAGHSPRTSLLWPPGEWA